METQRKAELDRLVATAIEHQNAGRLAEADDAYRTALAIAPQHAVILHNLGVLSASRNQLAEAVSRFDELIAAEPRYASAHYNRAAALEGLGRREDAIRGYARTVALDPEHYASHRALGFLHLAQGNRDAALDHFARTYELRRGEDRSGIASASLNSSTRTKLLHDAELFRHLAQRTRNGSRFEAMARNYEAVGNSFPEGIAELSESDLEILGEDYNTAIHTVSTPEIADGAVRQRDELNEIVSRFRAGDVGAVQVDDVLTPRALSALKRYLLESTIWHDFSHIGGFVASYLEDGLACPLVLQIADELRGAFPELLGEHPLSQAWAFKGLRPSSAVDIHADDAAISVNLWVTATAANLRPDRGGLVVYRAIPPADWAIREYEADKERIVSFLGQNTTSALQVPYGENRATIFESRLFHQSDAPEFAPGYENHRINLTLLYGKNAPVAGKKAR